MSELKGVVRVFCEYEFKGALEIGKPKSWLKTVSAFSNGLGGSIYFGVDKNGVPEGIDDIQKTSEKISQLVNTKIEPVVYVNMTPYYYSSDGNKWPMLGWGKKAYRPHHIF